MSISRYTNLKKLKNSNGKTFLEKPSNIKIPITSEDKWIVWRQTDSLPIISYKFYNNSEYYWVILAANNISIEGDIKPGQKIRIPGSIQTIVSRL